jgi:hypothetical protein
VSALDIGTLTRYSLKDCSLKPAADGEFVSYAALAHAIEKGELEREAVSFLRGVVPQPLSVRARLVQWMRGVFRQEARH